MTKSERLMFMIELLRNHDRLVIGEIASHCEVSERTAYRDIGSLYRMRIPLTYKNGYKIDEESQFPPVRLSSLDRDLFRFCLRTNSLNSRKSFRERLRIIEEVIVGKLDTPTDGEDPLFIFGKMGESRQTDKSNCLITFVEALVRKQKISLRWKGGGKRAITAYPVAVKVTSLEVRVHFSLESEQEEKTVGVNQLLTVEIV